MKKSSTVIFGVVFLGAVVGTAGAGPRRDGGSKGVPNYGTSCIDGNANGVCTDASDIPLGRAIDANGLYIDSDHGSRAGLVLQGGVTLPNFIHVQVTRDIIVTGSVDTLGTDLGASFLTLRGNVMIAPRTTLTARTPLEFGTVATSSKTDVGAGCSLTVSGNNTDLTISSNGVLHVGTGQKIQISGAGYANIRFNGFNGTVVDPGQTITGSNRGGLYISSGGDLTLQDVNFRGGYFIVRAYPSLLNPGPRRLVIRDSHITQSYRHGNLKVLADVPPMGSVVIDHTSIVTANTSGGIVNPPALCISSTAPIWACN